MGFLDRGHDRVHVQRAQATQVDHVGFNAFAGEDVGCLFRNQRHAGIAAERYIAAGAAQIGLPDGDAEITAIGSLAAGAVEQDVLDEHHRVVQLAARAEQADDVPGR